MQVGETLIKLVNEDPAAKKAAEVLLPLGDVFVVGGAVRDVLLGKAPKDIDMMAKIDGDEIAYALGEVKGGRVMLTGVQFPVYRFKYKGGEVEIALPRTETKSGEGNKDWDIVSDPNIPVETDLERRDFTSNAMAFNLRTQEVIDPFKGAEDLQAGILRTVSPTSFRDDSSRTLRALTQAAKHGLEPDEVTREQMKQFAPELYKVPREAIMAEMDKIFKTKNPHAAMRLAQETGVLEHFLPMVAENWNFDQLNPHHVHTLGEHLLSVLEHTVNLSDDPDLRLAAFLHDIGKPASQWIDEKGVGHYYRNERGEGQQHEEVGAEMAQNILRELKYPNTRVDQVTHYIRHHMFPAFNTLRGARKFLQTAGSYEQAVNLLYLRQADMGGKDKDGSQDVARMRALLDQVHAEGQAVGLKDLAVNGRDIIDATGAQGPEIGRKLNALLEMVIEDPSLNNRETLLELAKTAASSEPVVVEEATEAFLRGEDLQVKEARQGTWNFRPYMHEIAQMYEKLPHAQNDPTAVSAWKELAADSVRRAAELGKQYDVRVVDFEPYENAEQQDYSVRNYNRFDVSRQHSDHPIWTEEENVAFRTVHDLMGHIPTGGDFSWEGELRACGEHFKYLSPNARRALFTECIGQTAYVNVFGRFPDQKVALFPNFDPEQGWIPNPTPQLGDLTSDKYRPGLIYSTASFDEDIYNHILDHGGGTFYPDGSPYLKNDGYAVAIPGYEEVYDLKDFDPDDIDLFIGLNEADLSANRLIGAWIEGGKVYLDISEIFNKEEEAASAAALRGEKAYWDFAKQEAVYVDDFTPRTLREALNKNSAWSDVAAKAKRLKDEGRVKLLRNSYNLIVSDVEGDTGKYRVEIDRQDPNSRAITGWTCECPWAAHAFQRTRQWKKFEGRLCSHAMATFWQSQASPLEEDEPLKTGPAQNTPPATPITDIQNALNQQQMMPQPGIESIPNPAVPTQIGITNLNLPGALSRRNNKKIMRKLTNLLDEFISIRKGKD